MTLPPLLTLAMALFVFIMLALCATWAWTTRSYLLAVPLTIMFLAACVGIIWMMERWGT